ncbi:hypothetical protein ACDQ55_14510 [Chitinophaga sp. 30R24]|uniref:hypothetical protein n=1 Tax=Chitinophaga sp. 30R24 TaxID=3248838 RepID=UPI003B8FE927
MQRLIIIICLVIGMLTHGRLDVKAEWYLRPDTSGTCISAVKDTGINPYTLGIAGNWRPNRSYTYYSARKESDATVSATDIRNEGAFASFIPFWNRRGSDNTLQPQADTTVWVWNSESTLFNTKGFELENKDPLGRYNAGQYGYANTLPVAVTQNARYREALFEGFEDYDFAANTDTVCAVERNIDFGPYQQNLDSNVAHTGKYSLLVDKNSTVSVGAQVLSGDDAGFDFTINTGSLSCFPGAVLLKSIRADGKVILPSFSPQAGKRMIVSVWVREQLECDCSSYSRSTLTVNTGTASVMARPSGNIIEGWQQVTVLVDVPAGATTFSVVLSATGNSPVYFDDLRIHPYNANMKSYVYDPVNLRLMAELDENNYAAFYEYDDDGTLIRVKKETERGVKTITESRSALIKE